METHTFTFKRKKSKTYTVVASLMLLWGIYWLQYFLFGGIVLSIGSLFFISTVDGIQLDLNERKYRKTRFIGDNGLSGWKDLPDVKYLSVFRAIITQTVRGRSGTGVTSKEKVVQINLIHGQQERLKVYQSEDIDEAFEKAKFIAEKLDLKIYDATTREAKWID
jgi:hypothetical protein